MIAAAERKAKKQHDVEIYENQFASIVHEWFAKKYTNLNPSYAKRVWRALEKDILPYIGKLPITKIDGPALRKCLMKIEERGAHETAHRTLQICARIYGYANACGYCTHDPTRGMKTVLTPAKTEHFPAITDPKLLGELLRAMESYDSLLTRSALFVGAYTFVRPGNLRQAEWQEISLEDKVWKIPAEKMKLKKPHIVPLANQVKRIFEELHPLTHKSDYVFPSVRDRRRPMSEATVNAALRRMGYGTDEMTGHGFRHIASTLLNEQGVWNADAIERQLAHTDRSKIRATYDHSNHLPERRKIMQAWADYLDGLRTGNNVVSFNELKMASS